MNVVMICASLLSGISCRTLSRWYELPACFLSVYETTSKPTKHISLKHMAHSSHPLRLENNYWFCSCWIWCAFPLILHKAQFSVLLKWKCCHMAFSMGVVESIHLVFTSHCQGHFNAANVKRANFALFELAFEPRIKI